MMKYGKEINIVRKLPTFLPLLTILFITLKLTGYIDWSWWLVLAPLWGAWALIAILLGKNKALHDFLLLLSLAIAMMSYFHYLK